MAACSRIAGSGWAMSAFSASAATSTPSSPPKRIIPVTAAPRMPGSGSAIRWRTLRTALSRPIAQNASIAAARTARSGSSKRRKTEFAKRSVCRCP